MNKSFTDRLQTLEARAPTGEAGRIFLRYDDDPPTYLIDGQQVGAGEWHERAQLAGRAAWVINVNHEYLERPE